jgi:hypothetical protein
MNKLATALGALLVAIGIAAIFLWQEVRAQRAQNAAGMTHLAALESRHPDPAAQPDHGSPTATAQVAVTTANAGQAPAPRDPSASRGVNPLLAQVAQMRNSPEGQEYQRIMLRQRLDEEYADVAKQMNLSPDKVAKLLDLLVKRRMDLAADSSSQQSRGPQDRAARAELTRIRAERERAFEAELKYLLGDSYPKWPEYQSAAAERQQEGYIRMAKEDLRHAISSGNSPLTDAQFAYLDSAITAEQNRIDQESRGMNMQQQLQRLPETNRRLVEVAAAHLNPQQLDRYRRYLEQQQGMMSAIETLGGLSE